MLDPFLPLLTSSLTSRHTKVLTHSLHSLLPLLRLPLPSLAPNVHRLVSALFGVLRKYARSGEVTGSNRELVIAAFKVSPSLLSSFSSCYTSLLLVLIFLLLISSSWSMTFASFLLVFYLSHPLTPPPPPPPSPSLSATIQAVTVLLRDVKQSQISEDELKLLLSYVEEDVHDYRRQVTAFPLLRVNNTNVCTFIFSFDISAGYFGTQVCSGGHTQTHVQSGATFCDVRL